MVPKYSQEEIDKINQENYFHKRSGKRERKLLKFTDARCYDGECENSSHCQRYLQRNDANTKIQTHRALTLRDRRTGECEMFVKACLPVGKEETNGPME